MVYPIFRYVLRFLVWLFSTQVEGIEFIPRKGPFIVAANHASFLDPLLLACAVIKKTDQKVHFIAYRGRFSYLGDFIIRRWAGCILVRYNKKEIAAALSQAGALLREGAIVGIFPGAPHHDLRRPKKGVALLALAARCPVLPAAITGTDEILPSPSIVPRRVRHARIRYMEPIMFCESGQTVDVAAKEIGGIILAGLCEDGKE